MTASTWAIVMASGKDEMLNSETCTAFLNLHNKPVLSYSLSALEHCADVDGVIVVAPKDRLEQVVTVIQLFGCHKVRKVVPGGVSEFASFSNALKYVDEDASMMLVHEASRPGIKPADVAEMIKVAKRQGLAMAGKQIDEATVILNKTGAVEEHPEPGSVWTFGTPVAFKQDVLDKTLKTLRKKKKTVKTLLDAWQAAGQKFKLVGVQNFAVKIDSNEHLRVLEQSTIDL